MKEILQAKANKSTQEKSDKTSRPETSKTRSETIAQLLTKCELLTIRQKNPG